MHLNSEDFQPMIGFFFRILRATCIPNTLDGIFLKKLRAECVGATPPHAEPFSKEEENMLWENGLRREHIHLRHFLMLCFIMVKGAA